MRKKLLIVLGLFVVLLGGFATVVATQPTHYTIERTADIAAPSGIVFEQVNDFHNWPAWSPWAKLDPDMKTSYEGPAKGEGAVYKWSGNDKVGEGQMTIRESTPDKRLWVKLEFRKPFEDTCTTIFELAPAKDGGTNAKWLMTGRRNFFAKGVGLFMDMDKMIGGDFEKGLASLKTVCEAKAKESRTESNPAP